MPRSNRTLSVSTNACGRDAEHISDSELHASLSRKNISYPPVASRAGASAARATLRPPPQGQTLLRAKTRTPVRAI